MKISRPVAFGMGVIMTLVIGSGTAYAATGGKFILGKSNSAGKTTSLANKKGTALSLSSKAGTPSLKVNRTTKVANLNSDMVDGLDSTKLALAAGQTNTVSALGEAIDIDDPADGIPDLVMAFATCPAGTKLTGGGADDYTDDGVAKVNSPLDRSTWIAISSTADVSDLNAENLVAYAQCYNPRGAVPGADFRVAATPSSKAVDKAIQRGASLKR